MSSLVAHQNYPFLYANYLGQHLRYQHSLSPGAGPAHGAHAYQPAGQQVLLPGALQGAGAMMLPGVAPMTPMTSVMGYGQFPQYTMQVPVQSMHGYGSPLLGLQGYASYPGWAQSLAQAQAQAQAQGVSSAASRGSSYAAAAGLPVLRGQLPGLPGAFPAMATAAPVFFPQLLSGLPAVIPR
ncbi:Solute carrier family 13 member 2 [Frankliniella fusca]|uniref:Solute carrier family 13 member 2 n=1 Tax=Frankliniella fusca TaxID=407009 RepID=A0AAE1HQP0_9NEOP|nr:Solute carrier family 13 member 2 [Frankliniella fusca]